jgi:hypothetical protein
MPDLEHSTRKGTTKNAHTQVKQAIFFKMIDKVYPIQSLAFSQARLKVRC